MRNAPARDHRLRVVVAAGLGIPALVLSGCSKSANADSSPRPTASSPSSLGSPDSATTNSGTTKSGPAVSGAATAGPALTVDVSGGHRAIDPDVYGMNFVEPKLAAELQITSDRWGGDSTSRYNFKNNTQNLAQNWFFENVHPDISLDQQVGSDLSHHTQPVVSVPMIGWVAKDSPSQHPFACGFKVSKYGKQQYTDQYDENCGNGQKPDGSKPVTGNNPTDTSMQEGPSWDAAMVQHFVDKYGKASDGGVATYELDNEPSLWNSTQRDVHPNPVTEGRLAAISAATAKAIKSVDPFAAVEGPGDWGWCAYFFSAADPGGCSDGPDRRSHGGLPAAAYYLQAMAAASKQAGQRLLDYFDEHYYPQVKNGQAGTALAEAGDAATQAQRLRSTRSLWDPQYTDESWTNDLALGPVMLIPRMREWVDTYYPGTKLAISEYNWGGLESINGALAEADVLGIFGREGLDRALIWTPPKTDEPGAFAFRMYRNYDGVGGKFGDTAVTSSSTDQDRLSVYAAQRGSDDATTIMVINKTGKNLHSSMSVAGADGSAAKVFTYSAADLHHVLARPDASISGGQLTFTYPSDSITLLVIGG